MKRIWMFGLLAFSSNLFAFDNEVNVDVDSYRLYDIKKDLPTDQLPQEALPFIAVDKETGSAQKLYIRNQAVEELLQGTTDGDNKSALPQGNVDRDKAITNIFKNDNLSTGTIFKSDEPVDLSTQPRFVGEWCKFIECPTEEE